MTQAPPPQDALALRTGLPVERRLLLKEYPREDWAADPHFHGLVSFWLDRHQMFRRPMELMQSETRALIDRDADQRRFAARLSRLGGTFVGELHGHHQIADHHHFPILAAKEPRIARGFAILDAGHHALDGALAGFVKRANAVLSRQDEAAALRTAAGRLDTDLARLAGLLSRHLTDEEDLIVPIILRHGARGLD